jgi:uncharacterized protein with PQ loop repeat
MSAINCADIDYVDKGNLVVSLLISAGIILSYLPQHLRIRRLRTSDGLSPFFLLLGVTSCTNSLINIAVLQWNVLRCCSTLSSGVCFANSLGVVQLLLQWIMFTTTVVLFLIYFPRPRYFPQQASVPSTSATSHSSSAASRSSMPVARHVPRHTSLAWNISLGVSLVALGHFILFAAISLSFLRRSATRERAIAWANWLGGSAMVLSACQYIPQIWTTIHRKSAGSLSTTTLAVQAPGSFLFAWSIAQRPGVRWSSWVLFIVTGALQCALLSICLFYRSKSRFKWGEHRQIERERRQRLLDEEEDQRTRLLNEQTQEEEPEDLVTRSGYVSP